MKQYLIQYLNIVVGVLATVLDVNRYFWIDRINYIYESITQKQLFSTFPHAGQGAPKTLTVFTYSVEYPTVALKGSMHRKKKWTFKTQKANPANVFINLTTRQITETACKYPPGKIRYRNCVQRTVKGVEHIRLVQAATLCDSWCHLSRPSVSDCWEMSCNVSVFLVYFNAVMA